MVAERGAVPTLAAVKAALNPFATSYAKLVADVRELDDSTLAILAHCAAHLTTTNCWWAAYQVAESVQAEARWEIKNRSERDA